MSVLTFARQTSKLKIERTWFNAQKGPFEGPVIAILPKLQQAATSKLGEICRTEKRISNGAAILQYTPAPSRLADTFTNGKPPSPP